MKHHFVCFFICFVLMLLFFAHSNHCAPRVSVRNIWQWAEQCLRCGCRGPEDQSLLCRGWCVPQEFQVGWHVIKNIIHCNNTVIALKKKISLTFPSVALTLQNVFGVWRLRCDAHVLLASAEGWFPLSRMSTVQQAGLPAAAASEGNLLPLGPSASSLVVLFDALQIWFC